jgi:hypothetical protein
LLKQHFSHLLYGYCTLYVYPFVFYIVVIAHLEDEVHTLDVVVSDEAKPSWLVSSFVLQNDAVFDGTKMFEVTLEYFNL